MSIYRRLQRCKFDVYLYSWHDVPKEYLTPEAMEACRAGARVLTLIMQDLRVQLELYTAIDLETALDATELITVASFFYFGPLIGMAMATKDKAKTRADHERVNSQIAEMDQLYRTVSEAQRALSNLQTAGAVRVLEDITSIYSSTDRFFSTPVQITLLSPIELLMRIVTARQTWKSLGMILEAEI